MLTPTTPAAGLTLGDILDFLNQAPSTAQGFTISALEAVVDPLTELDGAIYEVETPNGPVAGSYKNKKLATEQLLSFLNNRLSIAAGVSGAPQWASGSAYSIGALAYNLGITYRAKTNIANSTTAPGSDTTNWEAVGGGTAVSGAPQWVAGPQKQYALVSNAGKVFLVLQNIANGQAAPTATNAFYLLVGPTPATPTAAPQWVSGTSYLVGALVYDQGIIYRAKQAVTSSTTAPGTDTTNWLAPAGGTSTPATAATKVVEYTVTAGQTSITPGQLSDLANATSVISIGNAANDGKWSPGFNQRADQNSPTKGYLFDPSTHTINWSAGVLDQAYTLSITLALGVVGAPGTPTIPTRDPYDVPTAKRKEVVDANTPAYMESDDTYYGKEFVDEVYGPGQPAYYKCMPSAPAQTGGATVWKWFRLDIL